MARNEPSLADLLADDMGNLRPEAVEFLMNFRPAAPGRQRNRQPQNRQPRNRRPGNRRRWIGLSLALLFLIVVTKALTSKTGKEKPVAATLPKTKPVETEIHAAPKIVPKPLPKINRVQAKPMAKLIAPSTIKVVTQKPKVKIPLPAPKRQEPRSRIVDPAELGYDAVERAREIETKAKEKLIEGPYPVISEQDYDLGIEGPR